jgi:hypothetical protein
MERGLVRVETRDAKGIILTNVGKVEGNVMGTGLGSVAEMVDALQ